MVPDATPTRHVSPASSPIGDRTSEELEAAARAILAPEFYDYYAGGAGEERTSAANLAAWRNRSMLPHVLRNVTTVDIGCSALGVPLQSPIVAAPTACHRMAHPEGEVATARGLGPQRLLIVSTRSSRRFEDIGAVGTPWWFQIYKMQSQLVTEHMISRAVDSGARALVLTGDTPVVGRKRRNRGAVHWPDDSFMVNAPVGASESDLEQSAATTFEDIDWLRQFSGLPVFVKGVLRADDATRCIDAGAAGVIVSNHGGRQLDRAVATADALYDVAAAVNGAVPVLVDGGIRSGLDAAIALCIGATAVMLGRPLLWGLTVNGAEGVSDVFNRIEDDLTHTMKLLGVTSLSDLNFGLLAR
jgi:4-hydroxymandelate oxidase